MPAPACEIGDSPNEPNVGNHEQPQSPTLTRVVPFIGLLPRCRLGCAQLRVDLSCLAVIANQTDFSPSQLMESSLRRI